MKSIKPRKCKHCKKLFLPDYRTAERQQYCSDKECRQASHRASQRRWLRRPKNRDYFQGPEHRERVYAWRKKHPDWRSGRRKKEDVLHDDCHQESPVNRAFERSGGDVLHDDCLMQSPVIVGLIAKLTGGGSVLHDEIEEMLRKLHSDGQAILGIVP